MSSNVIENISSVLQIQEKIKTLKKDINILKKAERDIFCKIEYYFNENPTINEIPFENIIVTNNIKNKKISLNKTNYKEKVKQLLYSKGIFEDDFIEEILNKTENVISHQIIKFNKIK
jgi:hypothetical protein